MRIRIVAALLLYQLPALSGFGQLHFTDVSEKAGIKHVFKVYEGMFGGGACVFDYNNDGWEDLYITSGVNQDVLYRNNANGTFTDVFAGSGLEVTKNFITQGVVSADFNRDGLADLFVTTITRKDRKEPIPRAINLLFLNTGNGKFRDATSAYGLDNVFSFSTGASVGDINADGWPDIFVGNYFNEYTGKLSVINDATVVAANQIAKADLFLNEGGKHFKDVYGDYGLSFRGFGFGGVFTDYDKDGDPDIIVNHDFGYKRTPDMLLRNNYPGKSFDDVAKETAMDLKINSMGTAVGDYNNDGFMDYYFTNIRYNMFMVSEGGKHFKEQAQQMGMGLFAISWGANFADFDHDGDVDLFVSNGDLNPNCVPMADFYFENQGSKFQEKAMATGLADYGIGRGSVVFDYDHDGDLDVLVVNQEAVLSYPVPSLTHLYRNDNPQGNWVKIKLKGVAADKNGMGCRIELEAGGKKMMREIDGGSSSHLSQNSLLAHFGLCASTKIDRVTVFWTGGGSQTITNLPVNKTITITEVPARKKPKWWLYLTITVAALGLGQGVRSRRKKR